MRELTLVRHAKSDWGNPGLTDHDRPLNHRGERNAPMMARRLAASGAEVQRILASTAVRARTTAEVFGAALGVPVELDEELYLASASTLLTKAAEAGSESGSPSVMVVAHDPGISGLASYLSEGGIDHMPTCAVARFLWRDGSWSEAIDRPADSWALDTPR
ncbi:MAG: SixA phosphatase family protein [Leucobacter sp.]